TGVDEGVGGCGPDATCTTGGQNDLLAFKDIDFAGFHFQRGDAENVACFIAQEVECHPFNEELGTGRHVTLIKRVQHGMTGTVSGGTGALDRLFAEVGSVTTEGTLVNGAVRVAVKRHAEVLKLIHGVGRFTAHEFDGVLVAEPVGTFHRVVHVPVPVVFAHVAQRGADTALSGDSMRTGREDFGENGYRQPRFSQLKGTTHAGPAGAYDHHIEAAAW